METIKFVALIILGFICFIFALEVLFVLLNFISSLFINTKKEYNKNSSYFRFLLHSSTALAIFFSKIHLHVTGLDLVPKGKRFLLVCNHRSNWDPLTTWHVLRKYDLAFITKPENLKRPIYGRIIQKCCFMPIDRENPRLAIPTIERAINLLKNDEVSVAVYPEGSRNTKPELLPFHAAVFKIATKAKVPVVVMTINKTETIAKNFPFKRSDIYIDFIKVISEEEVAASRSVDLCNKCEQIIKVKVDEYNSSKTN